MLIVSGAILDLGAGTGQLVAKAWTYLGRMIASPLPAAAFHFVYTNGRNMSEENGFGSP